MTAMSPSASEPLRPSLVSLIIQRLALASVVAMVLQIVVVAAQYYYDKDQLTSDFISREARLIASGVSQDPSSAGYRFELPTGAFSYRERPGSSYGFRIVAEDRSIVAGAQTELISPLAPQRKPDLWFSNLQDGRWPRFVGGQHLVTQSGNFWVEIAVLDDPDHRLWRVIALELLQTVWLPTLPLVVLLLGVATYSIRRSLQPLVDAALQADRALPFHNSAKLPLEDMPREAASLTLAINRLLDRGADLLRAQKLFLATAAHELRTPLAIMTLELGKIPDPRARRLEADVAAMGELVARLLSLARLETIERPDFATLDLTELAAQLIKNMSAWADQHQHSLSFVGAEPVNIRGDATSVREAIRNLIENAVKHTPAGTAIRVRVGPDAALTVDDSGPGLADTPLDNLVQPFAKGRDSGEGAGLGLAIVKRTMELHHGQLRVGRSDLGGARFCLDFSASSATHPVPAHQLTKS